MEQFCLYGLVFLMLAVQSWHIEIAFLNDEAILPCGNEMKSESCHRVRWVKYANGTGHIILTRPKMSTNSPTNDAGRAKWHDGNGYSLSLAKVQKSDVGLYSCEIWRGWDRICAVNTTLETKVCKSEKLVAERGSPLNMTCPPNTTGTLQRSSVSWAMLNAGQPMPIASERIKNNGSSLLFSSVEENDNSWYRCNYMFDQVQHCYDINLEVKVHSHSATEGKPTREENKREREREPEPEAAPQQQKIIVPLVAAVASLLLVIVMAAVLAGLVAYCRRLSPTAQPSAGANLQSEYENCENVDYTFYKHSSIYQVIPDVLAED